MRVTVRLYGHLRQAFGTDFELDVDRWEDVCGSMLPANFDGFREHMIQRSNPGYWVIVDGEPMHLEHLSGLAKEGACVQIVPAVRGAADGKAIGSVIAGIALVIAGAFTFGATAIAGIAISATTAATIAGGMVSVGLSLTMGGISSMLTTSASDLPGQAAKKNTLLSTAASGAGIDTGGQGTYKAIRFGRQAVQGIPISTRVLIRHDAG
jgi:predicted phage tail protein